MKWRIAATLCFLLASCSSDGPILVRVGPQGRGPVFEQRFEYEEDDQVFHFEWNGTPHHLVFSSEETISPFTGQAGMTWWIELYRGSVDEEHRLIRTPMNDPQREESLGSCSVVTDFEHTGGLWIEVGVSGSRMTAVEACDRISSHR